MYVYIYIYVYMYVNSGQIYLLLAVDMTRVGGPLSVVKVFTHI